MKKDIKQTREQLKRVAAQFGTVNIPKAGNFATLESEKKEFNGMIISNIAIGKKKRSHEVFKKSDYDAAFLKHAKLDKKPLKGFKTNDLSSLNKIMTIKSLV